MFEKPYKIAYNVEQERTWIEGPRKGEVDTDILFIYEHQMCDTLGDAFEFAIMIFNSTFSAADGSFKGVVKNVSAAYQIRS